MSSTNRGPLADPDIADSSRRVMPPCGCTDCGAPSFYVDGCGIGFCVDHEDGAGSPPCMVAGSIVDFDPWWAAAMLDPVAFDALEYGQWPTGWWS